VWLALRLVGWYLGAQGEWLVTCELRIPEGLLIMNLGVQLGPWRVLQLTDSGQWGLVPRLSPDARGCCGGCCGHVWLALPLDGT
jgi:hypothetical protein